MAILPQLATLNSAKLIEIGSIAKICSTKFNFSPILCVCSVTFEQLYSKDYKRIMDLHCTEKKFFIKDFFSKYDRICSFLRIWSHFLKKSLMENLIFCAVLSYNCVKMFLYAQYDRICSFLRIWSHFLKKSLMENLIFCAVLSYNCVKMFLYAQDSNLA